ncbi:MAG TPA: single-stranded-DNA-specific exonuclease RecJ [Terriglobales bacterium]
MSGAAERFQRELGLSPLLARLLAHRGWEDTAALAEFLDPQLSQSHAPGLMLGMEAAVERTLRAVAGGEPIRILGDYDVDGTLATVILRQALRTLGTEASYRLPQRLGDGYGLRDALIDEAVADGVRLAITVDTGIRELGPLRRAHELGLDVIVTDHHLPDRELPPALAILNPHQPGCGYPDKRLCGAAVAFKLAQALLERSGKLTPAGVRSYLKLVALATVADAVPLLGENRVLARTGLAGLAEAANPGLRALLEAAIPHYPRAVTSSDISFRVAPRLNAAGRMGGAEQVVELFFAAPADAGARAQALEALNEDRKRACAAIQGAIAAQPAPADAEVAEVLVYAGAGWHRGVLGIVASRMLEQTGRAVLVASLQADAHGVMQAHGSGRAPAGFHLLQRLDACRELFDRYGGHAQAVGFSLPAERLAALAERVNRTPAAAGAAPLAPVAADFELRLGDVTLALAQELARMEPWGEGNREPVFLARGVRIAVPPLILKERHAKLVVEQDGHRQTALVWNLWREGAYQSRPGRPSWERMTTDLRLDLRFRLEHTSHPVYGERLQLIVEEFAVTPARSAAN